MHLQSEKNDKEINAVTGLVSRGRQPGSSSTRIGKEICNLKLKVWRLSVVTTGGSRTKHLPQVRGRNLTRLKTDCSSCR